jgi:DNA-binding helix-hairpin-helix protein with protein kinase domain
MFRAFKRAAKFEREHEWTKKLAKEMTKGEQNAAWKKSQRDLADGRERDARAMKARQEQRRENHGTRVNEIRRTPRSTR